MLKVLFHSELLRSSTVYTLSTVINTAIPFLMMPVLTRYLAPTDYGIVAMFAVLVGIINPFVGLSLHGAVSVRYFVKEKADLPRFIAKCFMILMPARFSFQRRVAVFRTDK
jgi:O-antigen/teichoic acid export membrane protein